MIGNYFIVDLVINGVVVFGVLFVFLVVIISVDKVCVEKVIKCFKSFCY